jgi:hypothetical protein
MISLQNAGKLAIFYTRRQRHTLRNALLVTGIAALLLVFGLPAARAQFLALPVSADQYFS